MSAHTSDDSEDSPELQRRFTRVIGERVEDGWYYLHGLPAGADFRTEDSYDTIRASWLKIEGVGFSAAHFELGEHETAVVVTQETAGGGANLTFEDL